MQTLTELTGRTAAQINAAREQVRAGDLAPVKELLYDSALLLHGAALASVQMASMCAGFPGKNVDTALKAVEAVQKIFQTLAEHDDTNRLSTIGASLFQENLERIMKYIARKGGKVYRAELLTSRVITGKAIDYQKHLEALVGAGYLSENNAGRRKEIAYMIITNDPPQIELLDNDKTESLQEVHESTQRRNGNVCSND